jgi:ubiquinone/menaquinone biosynthesis C-methylase UbiE
MSRNLKDSIFNANIEVHKIEAPFYDVIHPEIYNSVEQRRIMNNLKKVDGLIRNNGKKALDFGAGTGNVTGKLLDLGYNVVAVDISREMCGQLKRKFPKAIEKNKLKVINSKIEDFSNGKFDLIVCFSVLHHLPDYVETIKRLSQMLKTDGVMLLEHELSPYPVENDAVEFFYRFSNELINTAFLFFKRISKPAIDYSLCDYWASEKHRINHAQIEAVFKNLGFKHYQRYDFYVNFTYIRNPMLYIYKAMSKPDSCYWIAIK